MEHPAGAGEPVATWAVPLSDVLVDGEILDAVHEAAASGWWSTGPRVAEFERAFATHIGSRHAVAVSSGTAAIQLALLATECGPGDEVVLPSLNFVAAANAVTHAGARPVLCDIHGECNLNLDPQDVEAAITGSTKAILVLHYGGYSCDMETILEIAQHHRLIVIEDAAHAPGASWGGSACGTFGAVGCFSFFANKNLPVGEGGMLVTDDAALDRRLRLLRSHGMTTLTWARHQGHASSYDVLLRGFNFRFDEIRAAIGLVQLGRLDAANRKRREIASVYRRELDGIEGMTVPFGGHDHESSAHHLATVVVPSAELRVPLREHLRQRRVQTSLHYPPIHRFSEYSHEAQRALPVTDDVSDRLVTLPLYPHMTELQVKLVVDSVLEYMTGASARVRARAHT